MILGAFWLALILLIWFRTHAIEEYAKVLRLDKLLKIDEYEAVRSPELSYPQFLSTYYNSFLTRLVACPICISCWLGILLSGFSVSFPVVTLLGLSLYASTAKLLEWLT